MNWSRIYCDSRVTKKDKRLIASVLSIPRQKRKEGRKKGRKKKERKEGKKKKRTVSGALIG